MAIQEFSGDLDIIQALVIPQLESDLDVIGKLDDEPNDVGGLTPAQLKAKFDEAGNLIKHYLNETLLPAVSDTVAEDLQRQANEEGRQAGERARTEGEESRKAAEAVRVRAEILRQEGEEERRRAEEARVSREAQRVWAERARELEHRSRADETEGIVARAAAQADRAAGEAEAARGYSGEAYASCTQARVSAEQARIDGEGALLAQAEAAQSASIARTGGREASASAAGARLSEENARSWAQLAEDLVEGAESALAGKLDADRAGGLIRALTCSGEGVLTLTRLDGGQSLVDTGLGGYVPAGVAGNAAQISFADGETMQEKLARGAFNGRDGLSVSLSGIFALRVDQRGHLIAEVAEDGAEPPVSVSEEGHLIYTV